MPEDLKSGKLTDPEVVEISHSGGTFIINELPANSFLETAKVEEIARLVMVAASPRVILTISAILDASRFYNKAAEEMAKRVLNR